jgi:hypothetical protein
MIRCYLCGKLVSEKEAVTTGADWFWWRTVHKKCAERREASK